MLRMKVFAADNTPCIQCSLKKLPKANELPFYENTNDVIKHKSAAISPTTFEGNISVVRKKAFCYVSAVDVFLNQAIGFCSTGIEHSKNTYDYIRQEENIFPRTLAIASGGLLGLIFAVRGGAIRKITYSTMGIGAVSAACYPNEAKSAASLGFELVSNKIGDMVKSYKGSENISLHDLKQEKVFSSTMEKVENVTKSVKNIANKIYPMEKMAKHDKNAGDVGQSDARDSDMYTTRS